MSQCSLRQCDAAPYEALFCKMREALCIFARPARLGKNCVITRHLAFDRNLPVDPPDSRMEEKHCLHDLLGEIGPIIPTLEMCQFMEENLIQLNWGELADDPLRDQN